MPARSPSTRRTDVTDRLYRSPDDRMLSGVAGGLAEMLDIDPSIVRIVWAVLVPLTGGIALLVYIVMAIVVPERPPGAESGYVAPPPTATSGTSGTSGVVVTSGSTGSSRRSDRSERGRGGLVAGLILIVVGGFFLIRQFIPAIDLGVWWPAIAIGLGVVLVVVAVLPSRRSN
jgi:phage shock protein C